MDVCIIGSGYVGLTTGAVLAKLGHHITCVDKDENKIQLLNNGEIPIYEPGLEKLVKEHTANGRLSFTTDVKKSIEQNEIIMIAVGTPLLPDNTTNLSYLKNVITDLAGSINGYKTIITKSTVPVGTNEWIHQRLIDEGFLPNQFQVVSNPEFLKEGSAIQDMLYPDKIVVGTKNEDVTELIKNLYKGIDAAYIVTNLNGAELIKYASNAFLATKISYINELSRICDAFDVDIKVITAGLGTDPRIGPAFLNAGIGYGGSCFPKDLMTLMNSAKSKNLTYHLLEAVQKVNETQIDVYVNKLKHILPELEAKTIAVWGISFKPDTDDIRYSPSLKLIDRLVEEGCQVQAYDPIAVLKDSKVRQYRNIYQSVAYCDALIIATDWNEFINADWKKVKQNMKGSILLDGRNCLNAGDVRKHGLQYFGVGRPWG